LKIVERIRSEQARRTIAVLALVGAITFVIASTPAGGCAFRKMHHIPAPLAAVPAAFQTSVAQCISPTPVPEMGASVLLSATHHPAVLVAQRRLPSVSSGTVSRAVGTDSALPSAPSASKLVLRI
jgi:hypothetical protein